MKLRKNVGIETLKSRYAYIFVTPWIIGLLWFFVFPLLQSVLFSFSNVTIGVGKINLEFVGLKNFEYILTEDPLFVDNLFVELGKMFYTVPLIIIISLVIGILLNAKFKGRMLFRAVYFLPVIIAAGPVLKLLFMYQSGNITNQAQEEAVAGTMIDVSTLIAYIGLPTQISEYLNIALSGLMNIIWNCGIQIVLFIAGMQTIPDLLYEVSKVEGATKWEEFWFITFPLLSQVVILVMLYTIVEMMTLQTNSVMMRAYTIMYSQNYGDASAMLWLYFVIVGIVSALVFWVYMRFCVRRYE
jgi:ABC-type sugar transport system permease subunit